MYFLVSCYFICECIIRWCNTNTPVKRNECKRCLAAVEQHSRNLHPLLNVCSKPYTFTDVESRETVSLSIKVAHIKLLLRIIGTGDFSYTC